ncbi:RES family NAD+ phosphorylase [Pedobacter agri]|uniref:RES family NAD+ phosphorylase n=1 Tax=Pedobacter agri TaxID=454586 RepID=UPI00292DD07E|nr:RES family NAD+ phosphorylase [Pedobacter agri]
MKVNPIDKICHECVGEKFLSNEIENIGKRGKCRYCGFVTRTYTIDKLTSRIETVILDHYERTPSELSDWEYYRHHVAQDGYHWYREGQTILEILSNEYNITELAAQQIAESLESTHADMDATLAGYETEFDSEARYEIKWISDGTWANEWASFERTLKTEARFFNHKNAAFLESIFDEIEEKKTWSGKSVFTCIGPNTEITAIYRARVFQSQALLLEALCRPDRSLAAPSYLHSMNGRMNSRGISVFYGAMKPETALAEVRPPVGSKVAIGKFEILRPLQVLDLRKLINLNDQISVFDPLYLVKKEKTEFLRKLGTKMTTPVMPDDELFEYLPTQVIADFLANRSKMTYDGIIYPSIQVEGEEINVVLFHKAAKTELIDLPEGAEIIARDEDYEEDGPYESYWVAEMVPAKRKENKTKIEKDSDDSRVPSLRIDLESVTVNKIEAVSYNISAFHVNRVRQKKIASSPRKITDL